MAPVGQTCPQSVHVYSQLLCSKIKGGTSRGEKMPASPASKMAGCKTLVGQTFMHSPQRMHRLRKVFWSAAPGGGTKLGGTGEPAGPSRAATAVPGMATPAAMPVSTPRRERSTGRGWLLAFRLSPKRTMPFGQWSTHSMHRVQAWGERPAAGSRASMRHRSGHWPHALQTRTGMRFTTDQRANRPNSAPAGQSQRHQNRRAANSRAKITSRIAADTPARASNHGPERQQVLFHEWLQHRGRPAVAAPGEAGVGLARASSGSATKVSPRTNSEKGSTSPTNGKANTAANSTAISRK